jgi:hypothetical protein
VGFLTVIICKTMHRTINAITALMFRVKRS